MATCLSLENISPLKKNKNKNCYRHKNLMLSLVLFIIAAEFIKFPYNILLDKMFCNVCEKLRTITDTLFPIFCKPF